jgi:Flp pilus assembly protein TadG
VILLVPVIFGLIGFAYDLGILYSSKAELKTAADSMALAAAQQLIGTDASGSNSEAAALLTVENITGLGNKYYFHSLPVGQTTGTLSSTISDPAYYATAADAIASITVSGSEVPPAQAKYVRMTVTGETPLLFWGLLPSVSDRKLAVLATAVAGVSAPLCVACGIEPIVVAALNTGDTTNFGLTPGTEYSFAYTCVPGPTGPVPVLAPGAQTLSYALANRLNPNALIFPDEASQAYRDGAGGLPGSTDPTEACFNLSVAESIWPGATAAVCGAGLELAVSATLCGLDTRFESTPPTACSTVPALAELASAYQPDTDTTATATYTDYAGYGRRILTIPIVNALTATGMTVLGFRQFLLEPGTGTNPINPSDTWGRFVAMYIGSVAPVQQGRFDGCTQAAGPGKVVLHQ